MSNLKRTAIFITILAIFLKLSGFLRESIIAMKFGANEYTDGYLMAFSIITLIVAMISTGFNNVFLPLYIKHRQQNAPETEKNASGVMNSTVVFFLMMTILLYFLVPVLVPVLFPHIHPVTSDVVIEISQFFLLFSSAIALNGILESYLQAKRVFVPAQISRILATLMGAVFALLFADIWGIMSLAYGFVVGTLLGAVLQFYYLRKSGFHWTPNLFVGKEFRTIFLILLIPSLINSVVGQINMFVNKIFALGTTTGAVTYLNNASLLVSIPNAIYATTIAAIIFTLLSERANDKKRFQDTVFMGMEISLVTLMPIAVGLLIVGKPAISFIYERGNFSAEDTINTYRALVMYIPIIVAQGLQYIVGKGMYALEQTKTIMKISLTTIILNAALNFVTVKPFGYPGLAITSSIVQIYFLIVSTYYLFKEFDKEETTRIIQMSLKVILPTLVMAVPLYLIQRLTNIESLYSLMQLAVLVPLGALLYIIGTYTFNREGYYRMMKILRKSERSQV